MVEMVQADRFTAQRLRAPSEHGQTLIHPGVTTAANSIETHQAQLSDNGDLCWLGKPWSEIVSTARHDLWSQAVKHSSEYLDPGLFNETNMSRVVLLGHQPELFHPGVWFKNFFAATLAEKLSAVSINLLIDNATLDAPTIQVPTGSKSAPLVENIAFDRATSPVPFEARDVLDLATFTSFADRISRALSRWIDEPIVQPLWPQVVEAQRSTGNLGLALARGRHLLEQQWGIHNLDVPLSTICDNESFFWFLSCVLCQLPRFWEIHNCSLEEYRQAYRLRSKSHPVPTLQAEESWFEAPFWIWSRENPQRRPMYVRQQAGHIELTDQQQLKCRLSIRGEEDATSVVEQLTIYRAKGILIRPRALMTTMYARLVLSDLFIHGIGGGRYDQLTDVIVKRFFGITPPDFLTATATLRLPIDLPDFQQQALRDVEHQLRDIKFSPEHYISDPGDDQVGPRQRIEQLTCEKQTLLSSLKPGQSPTATWHQRLGQVNQELQAFATKSREQLEKQLESLRIASRQRSLLGSREFSFCLFPQKTLCPLLLALSREGL